MRPDGRVGLIPLIAWPEVAEALRPLTEHEEARLAESLKARGQVNPVLALMDGRVIDGFHRHKILGGDCHVSFLAMDEAEALALALDLNVARRQLTTEEIVRLREGQKTEVKKLRSEGKSQAEAAKAAGVQQPTVSKWEREDDHNIPKNNVIDMRRKLDVKETIEIMRDLKAGKSPKQIAREMGVTPETIRRTKREPHKEASLSKLRACIGRNSKILAVAVEAVKKALIAGNRKDHDFASSVLSERKILEQVRKNVDECLKMLEAPKKRGSLKRHSLTRKGEHNEHKN